MTLQPCDKTQRCLDLVEELATIFPEFAVHLVPMDDDYDRYVFHNSPTDSFDGIPPKLNDSGQAEYTKHLFYQFLDANCKEKDKGIYFADRDYSFAGAWGEGGMQAGINVTCIVVHSTGGTLPPFNPSDCMLSKYNY